MISGAASSEYRAADDDTAPVLLVVTVEISVSNRPPPTAALTYSYPAPDGVVPAKVVCAFSTERPSHRVLSKSLTIRKPGCRAQSNPTAYCASIVSGTFSSRGSSPLVYIVAKLQL